MRNGIFLDSKLIPVCMEDLDTRGNDLQLNAYVVDFFVKQHFYSLVSDNRLSDGQTQWTHDCRTRSMSAFGSYAGSVPHSSVSPACLLAVVSSSLSAFAWGLLKSWCLLLGNITTALRTLSTDGAADPLVKSFDHLSTTFETYFNAIINV